LDVTVEIVSYDAGYSNATAVLEWTQTARSTSETGDTCVAFADLQNSGVPLLFLTHPDGTVQFWDLNQEPEPVRQHLWTPDSPHECADLSGYNDMALGDGLAGVCATTNGHALCIWAPSQVTVLKSFTETPPTTRIMPEPNVGGAYARIDVRVWDAEGNGSLPILEFWDVASSNWMAATVSLIDGQEYSMAMAVTAVPTGCTHRLLWNAAADMGSGYAGTVKLRARAVDNSGWGEWSEEALYTLTDNRDGDGDTLPDAWELARGLDPTSDANGHGAGHDPDRDGHSNWEEYVADTDPLDGDSVLAITGILPTDLGMRIGIRGGTGAIRILETRLGLVGSAPWAPIFTNGDLPTPATTNIIDAGATNRSLFYRIRAERP